MVKISIFYKDDEKAALECPHCGYKIVKPYPKDNICPGCKKNFLELKTSDEKEKKKKKKKKDKKTSQAIYEEEIIQPKEFETKKITLSSKLEGKVKIKEDSEDLQVVGDRIDLQKGEYIKLIGITSIERTPLYCDNEQYVFLLELTNNLDFIATSILGGSLDKMLLITSNEDKEKCQWFQKNDIIYIIYGSFPDKKGKWLLEQMSNYFSELVSGKNIDNLDKLERYDIKKKFDSIINFLLEEYLRLQEVFSDQDIPYVEDKIRIDYLGLSSKSIGVISLLLGDELNVELPGVFESKEEEQEMKESVLTAKIEAIAANTIGNTDAMPKWIAVKLGFQNYRFLTFQRYKNEYFLYLLSEGNLGKLEDVEAVIEPYIEQVTDKVFSGNLRPFNKLKSSLKELFSKVRVFS
ncbi:MAG: hypothetical protein ACFFAO_13840 [Candidatus Hermodarchaeota archaeon]